MFFYTNYYIGEIVFHFFISLEILSFSSRISSAWPVGADIAGYSQNRIPFAVVPQLQSQSSAMSYSVPQLQSI